MEFRLAKKSDAKRLLEIYKPYVPLYNLTFLPSYYSFGDG